MSSGDTGDGALGNLDGQIGMTVAGIAGTQGHVPTIDRNLWSQRVEVSLGGAIIRRIDNQVRLHMQLVVAGSGDGHISMRYLDVDRRAGRNFLIEAAVVIVLLSQQAGKHILLLPAVTEHMHAVQSTAGGAHHIAQHRKPDNEHNQAPMRPSMPAPANVVMAAIQPPVPQREQTHPNQQQRPPAHVPVPQPNRTQLIGFDQQGDDPHNDQHQGADNRGWTKGALVVALRAGCVPLGIGWRQGGHQGLLLGSASGSTTGEGEGEYGWTGAAYGWPGTYHPGSGIGGLTAKAARSARPRSPARIR